MTDVNNSGVICTRAELEELMRGIEDARLDAEQFIADRSEKQEEFKKCVQLARERIEYYQQLSDKRPPIEFKNVVEATFTTLPRSLMDRIRGIKPFRKTCEYTIEMEDPKLDPAPALIQELDQLSKRATAIQFFKVVKHSSPLSKLKDLLSSGGPTPPKNFYIESKMYQQLVQLLDKETHLELHGEHLTVGLSQGGDYHIDVNYVVKERYVQMNEVNTFMRGTAKRRTVHRDPVGVVFHHSRHHPEIIDRIMEEIYQSHCDRDIVSIATGDNVHEADTFVDTLHQRPATFWFGPAQFYAYEPWR